MSIVAVLVAGVVGYEFGSKALERQALEHLVTARDARARQVEDLFQNVLNSLETYSVGDSVRAAMAEFDAAFDTLDAQPVSGGDQQALQQYYAQSFVPSLREVAGSEVTAANLMPTSPAQVYLQAHYIAQAPKTVNERVAVENAGDGSAWSQAHARHHDFFRTLMEEQGYEDVMLVDTDGNVVYTANKGIDLGANLFGPVYDDTLLSQGVRDVLRSNADNEVRLTDFEEYLPSLDRPTAFGITPVGVDGRIAGVMVIQLPVDRINEAMTTDENWRGTGLGDTGEVFLVGADRTMRSTSRLLVQDPQAYRRAANERGLSPQVVDEIVSQSDPILRQPIDSEAAEKGLHGETGTMTEENYLGRTVLTNYAPLAVDGLNWVVVGQIERSEALAPVHAFVRNLALAALTLVLLVTLASVGMARAFTRPVGRLVDGARRVTGGDLDARVEVRNHDEFGDLATAFNDMGARMRTTQDRLEEQGRVNDRLVSYLMPEPLAERYRAGEPNEEGQETTGDNLVTESPDVCVMALSIGGVDEFAAGRPAPELRGRLDELVSGIEAATASADVTLTRSARSGYVATCGLVVPRVDKALRVVDVAREVEDLVGRFNTTYGGTLTVHAGIDIGPVASGVVGTRATYDVWGEGLERARRIRDGADDPGVYLTQRAYDGVRDSYAFVEAARADTEGESVWKLATEDQQ